VPALQEMGIVGIFGPGASAEEIAGFIKEKVKKD
jgi:methylmalonyl-CoA mutase cobalamin-binding subunit